MLRRTVPWSWPSLTAGAVLSGLWCIEFTRWDEASPTVSKLTWLPAWAVVVEVALGVCAVLLATAAVAGGRWPWLIIAATVHTLGTWSFLAFEFSTVTSTWLLPSVCGAVALAAGLQLVAELRAWLADRWQT